MGAFTYIRNIDGSKINAKDVAVNGRKNNNYTDVAKFYDLDNNDNLNQDIPFYLEYIQENKVQSVLDLCCGTGRTAFEIAKAGCHVTALDSSFAMLEVFEQKYAKCPKDIEMKIDIVYGNAINFDLNKKFDLVIMPYRSFQQFAHRSEARVCLQTIKEHLNDGGKFILSIYKPAKVLDESWVYQKKQQWVKELPDGSKVVKNHWGKSINTEHQLLYPVLCYEVTDKQGNFNVFYEDLCIKYYYYEQIIDMIKNAGFNVDAEYGNYRKGNIKNGSDYIFVLSK